MRPGIRRACLGGLAALSVAGFSGAPLSAAPAPLRAPTPKEAAEWNALVGAAETARSVGDWKRLEKLTRRRVAIEERTFGPQAAVTAASWSWIAQALVRRGREAEAEPYYRKALEASQKALGERDPQTLLAVSNLASLLERQGRFAEAEPLRRSLLASARTVFGQKSPEAAAAAVALADVLRAAMRPQEAEPLYRIALEIDAGLFGDKDPRLAADLGSLGAALDDLGRHGEAEPLHRRALALRRGTFGERDAATAQAYARVARNLDAQGRHAEAEPLYRMALATDRDVRGVRHAATAADTADLGANLAAQGRHGEAEPLLRRALEIRRKTLGEKHFDTGVSYAALADTLAARGRPSEAEKLHRRALQIVVAARGEDHPAAADAYAGLGADLTARGRPAEAAPLLEKALSVRRAVLGERHPATARAYDALADNQHRLAAYVRAETYASRAMAIVRARRSADLTATGSDPDAALRRARADADRGEDEHSVFRRYLTVAWLAGQERPNDFGRLQNAAFTAAQDLDVSPAARALAQTAARAAFSRQTAADARVRQDLADQVRELEDQFVRALPQNDAAKAARIGEALDAVGRELAGLDARLARGNPKYAEAVAPRALSIAEAQKRLRPGEGLLLIVPTGQDVHVFALSKVRVGWRRIAGGQADLERRLRALRCQMDEESCGRAPSDGRLPAFDVRAAHAIYRDVLKPVEGALVGVDKLYVTASGPFGGLPLGLLPVALPSQDRNGAALGAVSWLADRYALTTLPAVASLRAGAPARRPPARNRRWAFVGFGDPTLEGGKPASRRLADPAALATAFPPLPGTANELKAMARTLGAPTASLRLGAKATERAIKTAPDLARADVVAFATHGLLSRQIKGLDEPGLVLTPPANASPEDDGVLTASEAAALELSANWVILSACSTAGADGQPGSDSLSGLARAFLYAGARALLVSHWRVFDDSTAALTVQTLAIQRANPKLTKAEALQRAMRVVRTGRMPDGKPLPGWRPEWAHPAYWAPFVVITAGD